MYTRRRTVDMPYNTIYAMGICGLSAEEFFEKEKVRESEARSYTHQRNQKESKKGIRGEKKHDMAHESLPSQITCSKYSWIPHAKTRA